MNILPFPIITDLTVSLRFVFGVVAAAVATVVMNYVMAELPEGDTPPRIAAGVLTMVRPENAPRRLATVIHYVAALLTGPLFVWLIFSVEALLNDTSLSVAVSAIILYMLMIGFFIVIVLPQSRVSATRVNTIRRDWALAAGGYLGVLVPLIGGVSLVL